MGDDGSGGCIAARIPQASLLTPAAHQSLSAKAQGAYHELREIRDRLVEDLEEFMGPTGIEDAGKVPGWRGSIMVDREKTACRADRRRG